MSTQDDPEGSSLKKAMVKSVEKEKSGAQIFGAFGDVIKLDLASHEKFGKIEILLGPFEVYRILEYAFEKIPTKTPYHEKCLTSIKGILLKHPKIPMIIHPVLNKEFLQDCDAYDV